MPEAEQQVPHQQSHTDEHFANQSGHRHPLQDCCIRLKNRHIQHKESDGQGIIDVVDKQGRVILERTDNQSFKGKKADKKQQEADEGDDERPEIESLLVAAIVLEVRIEPQRGGTGAEQCQRAEQRGGIHQHTGQAYLLRRQILREDKEGGHETDGYPDIGGDGSFDGLSGNDAHRGGLLIR